MTLINSLACGGLQFQQLFLHAVRFAQRIREPLGAAAGCLRGESLGRGRLRGATTRRHGGGARRRVC
eukprot:356064-Chlamydomonas_euryale.AAC.10